MRNPRAKSISLVFTAAVVGLVSVPSSSAVAKSWEEETLLISPQGDETVVRSVKGEKVLLKNADPQLAVEWALTSARTAVVLAGKYVVSESIDIPRDDVTLIIGQGAEISLNSSNRNSTIERLVGERSQEIIDMNASHADVREIVSVGKPQKLLCFCVGSGPRWTSRPRAANRLDVWQAAVLEDVADVRRRIEVPDLPDALPRFTVKAIVEVTLKDGSKKQDTKEVEVDVSRVE